MLTRHHHLAHPDRHHLDHDPEQSLLATEIKSTSPDSTFCFFSNRATSIFPFTHGLSILLVWRELLKARVDQEKWDPSGFLPASLRDTAGVFRQQRFPAVEVPARDEVFQMFRVSVQVRFTILVLV